MFWYYIFTHNLKTKTHTGGMTHTRNGAEKISLNNLQW